MNGLVNQLTNEPNPWSILTGIHDLELHDREIILFKHSLPVVRSWLGGAPQRCHSEGSHKKKRSIIQYLQNSSNLRAHSVFIFFAKTVCRPLNTPHLC